ncbi:MAG: hypothetical protein FWF70_04030 [Bacteroidetes bacterium]|nr:hypothetical protein [Bacteroidota bacterium]MCL1968567.1 hypothetical protein [Bacteroidota bacterium]
MKKFILSLLYLLLYISSFAQYESFFGKNSTSYSQFYTFGWWNKSINYDFKGIIGYGFTFDSYFTKDDTVRINDILYYNTSYINNITNIPNCGKAIGTIDAGYIVDEYCSSSYNLLTCICKGQTTPTVFQGFKQAIESTNSVTQYAINIKRSNFENKITGISLTGKNSFQLLRLDMALNTSYSGSPRGMLGTVQKDVILHQGNPLTLLRYNEAFIFTKRLRKVKLFLVNG